MYLSIVCKVIIHVLSTRIFPLKSDSYIYASICKMAGREYTITRPNREPKNKLEWGTFSGGVTVRKVTDTLKKFDIQMGSHATMQAAAQSIANNIFGMPQMHHANTQMTAIALYLLYEKLNFDGRHTIDMEQLNEQIDINTEFF